MAEKVNMSLDEIIKQSKARRTSNEASGSRQSFPKKQGARLSVGRGRAAGRPGGMRSTNFAKKIVKKSVQNLNKGNAARRNLNANSGGMIPRNEVKNIVNMAVKQAMKQQANVGIAGRLGGGKIPRNIITASKLAQLNQRSRAIQRNRVAPMMRQRGRGFPAQQAVQYVQEVVSPQPVRIIRQPIQAPVVQVVERVVPARQQIRKQFAGRGNIARVGGGGRIVRQTPAVQRVVQQQQRIIQRPVQRVVQQQRIIRQPQQQIIYERAAPQRVQQRVQVIRRQAPAQQVQVVRRQAPIQQRVQVVRRQAPVQVVRQNTQPRGRGNRQNFEYVEYASPASARVKNDRMRNALGLDTRGHVVREAQRFEPSSSFLANRTVSNVRGRGFSGRRNAY